MVPVGVESRCYCEMSGIILVAVSYSFALEMFDLNVSSSVTQQDNSDSGAFSSTYSSLIISLSRGGTLCKGEDGC